MIKRTMTTRSPGKFERGQNLIEYAIVLLLVAVVVITALTTFGTSVRESISNSIAVIEGGTEIQPSMESIAIGLVGDFINRINAYYAQHGRWPRSWNPYRFTDIGLDPADWSGLVGGLHWTPNGDKIGYGTVAGDPYIVYITNLAGQRLRLYDSWNIWCVAASQKCYYKTVAPQNEVDMSTLELVPR
jgi:Flp pilus assembly pilin Flp